MHQQVQSPKQYEMIKGEKKGGRKYKERKSVIIYLALIFETKLAIQKRLLQNDQGKCGILTFWITRSLPRRS